MSPAPASALDRLARLFRAAPLSSQHIAFLSVTMTMQARVAARHLVIALPRDAAEAAATLQWALCRLAAPGDAFTLLHVRPADTTAPPLAPLAPLEPPLSEVLSGGAADEQPSAEAARCVSELAAATGFEPRLLKLRTALRIGDALLAFAAAGDATARRTCSCWAATRLRPRQKTRGADYTCSAR